MRQRRLEDTHFGKCGFHSRPLSWIIIHKKHVGLNGFAVGASAGRAACELRVSFEGPGPSRRLARTQGDLDDAVAVADD